MTMRGLEEEARFGLLPDSGSRRRVTALRIPAADVAAVEEDCRALSPRLRWELVDCEVYEYVEVMP